MSKVARLFFLGFAFFLMGCSLNASIDFSSVLPKGSVQEKVVTTGMSLVVEPMGGTAPFTYAPSASGFLDTTTGIYTVPVNAPVTSETIEVTDSAGEQFQVKIRVRGFSEHRVISMPQGADDQNYPTDAVWLPSGEIFISAVGSDYEGERWVVYRSTDLGATWTESDHFMGVEYMGESHPLAMAATTNAVFTCGYSYSYNGNSWGPTPTDPNSVWNVRRSLDRGMSWETSDAAWFNPGDDHVCYDIAVAPGTGYVYAVGYLGNNWAVRESRDNGTTWTTIYDAVPLGTSGVAFQVAVAPNGTLFIIGEGSGVSGPIFLRGQESGGTWSWTPITNGMPSGGVYGDYELRGSLKVVDNLTAFYAFSQSGGKILKTSDGGDSWSVVYSGLNYLQGLTVTSDGVLFASGGSRSADWRLLKSVNGGTSWTDIDLDSILSQSGGDVSGGLPIVAHPSNGSVLAVQSDDKSYHVKTALSTDQGATWTARGFTIFRWAFYDYFQKMIRSASGDLYASIYYADENAEEPWSIWKSTDDGRSWNVVDEIFADGGPYASASAEDLLVGHDGAIYAAGYSEMSSGSVLKIRRSANGSTWSEVLSVPYSLSSDEPTILAKRGTQDTWVAISGSASSVQIASTSNGTTWTTTKTFALPVGVDRLSASAFTIDASGRFWLVLKERINAGILTTISLYSSTDGVTWTESRRGAQISGSYYSNGFLRVSEQGELVFWDGNVLEHSTDGGVSWSGIPHPTGLGDVAWIEGQLFYFYSSSTLGADVVGAYDPATSSWQDWESPEDRETEGAAMNRYDFDWGSWKNGAFLRVGPGEVYLQETFNDPYLGATVILRRLETSH